MAKLRLIFSKEGRAVYISHLDLMRTFQRVFMREGLILKHSQGFHPHPIISFALPLSVGQSSRCEILDFEVMSDTDGAGLAQRLNAGLPEGIKATDCYVPERPVKELAALRARVEFIYDAGVPAGARRASGSLSPRKAWSFRSGRSARLLLTWISVPCSTPCGRKRRRGHWCWMWWSWRRTPD